MPSDMTNSYNSAGLLLGLFPPARKLPDAISTLPSPSSLPLLSIKITLAPLSAARTPALNPARPAPTTKTSHEMLFIPASSFNSKDRNHSLLERFERLELIERLSSSKASATEFCSPTLWPLRSPVDRQRSP